VQEEEFQRKSREAAAETDEAKATRKKTRADKQTAGERGNGTGGDAGASSTEDEAKKTRDGKSERPPPDDATIQAEIKRLASLGKYAYQHQRKQAAKDLGLNLTFLDAEVRAAREARSDGEDGLPEIELWPHPVGGAELLDEIANVFRRHVSLPTRGEDVCPRL
jgi:hypothetical protein